MNFRAKFYLGKVNGWSNKTIKKKMLMIKIPKKKSLFFRRFFRNQSMRLFYLEALHIKENKNRILIYT